MRSQGAERTNLINCSIIYKPSLKSFNTPDFTHFIHNEPSACMNDSIFAPKVRPTAQQKPRLQQNDAHDAAIDTINHSNALVVQWVENNAILPSATFTMREIDSLLIARMAQVQGLIKQGYTHFALVSYPNRVPRWSYNPQNSSTLIRQSIKHYNSKLAKLCLLFEKNYPQCSFNLMLYSKMQRIVTPTTPVNRDLQFSKTLTSMRRQIAIALTKSRHTIKATRNARIKKLKRQRIKYNKRHARKMYKVLNRNRFFIMQENKNKNRSNEKIQLRLNRLS